MGCSGGAVGLRCGVTDAKVPPPPAPLSRLLPPPGLSTYVIAVANRKIWVWELTREGLPSKHVGPYHALDGHAEDIQCLTVCKKEVWRRRWLSPRPLTATSRGSACVS